MRKFSYSFFLLIFALLPFAIKAEAPEHVRIISAAQIKEAFELQSLGQTRAAFYKFRDAYQFALKNGESRAKLATLEELFIWYRRYGFNCGLMSEPAGCQDEYRSSCGYEKLQPLDPHQRKIMRDFLCGVGCIVSGVFCLRVDGKLGLTLIVAGGKYMIDSVNSMIEDRDEKISRIADLDKINRKAISANEGKQ